MKLIFCGNTALEISSRLASRFSRTAKPCSLATLDDAACTVRDLRGFDLERICDLVLSRNAEPTHLPPLARLASELTQANRNEAGRVTLARGFKDEVSVQFTTSLYGSGSATRKIDIVVPNDNRRFRSKNIERHIWTESLPPRSIYEIADGIYVTSPEFSILQIAREYDFVHYLAYVNELCGLYCRDSSQRGFFDRRALTSAAKLELFLESVAGSYGVGRLREIMPFVMNRAKSPMETALAIIMRFPLSRGGYGLSGFTLNEPIPFDAETQRMSGLDHAEKSRKPACGGLPIRQISLGLLNPLQIKHLSKSKLYYLIPMSKRARIGST